MTKRIIYIVSPGFNGGGAEEVASRWAIGLQQRGYQVIKFELNKVNSYTGKRRKRFDKFYNFFPSWLNEILILRFFLQKSGVKLIISLLPLTNLKVWMATLHLSNKPHIIFSEHSIPSELVKTQSIKDRVITPIAWKIYRYADFLIVPSHAAAANLLAISSISSEKVKVIFNPAIESVLDPNRIRNDNSNSVLKILVAGRLVKIKEPLKAIEVSNILRNQFNIPSDIHYIGKGPMKDEIKSYAENLDICITFHDWTSDWSTFLKSPSVLMHCSKIEGFANVIMTAANHRIPTVAYSGALGVADAIIPGITGILVEQNDPIFFAQAIAKVKDLKLDKIDLWLREFTISSAAESIEKLIGSLK